MDRPLREAARHEDGIRKGKLAVLPGQLFRTVAHPRERAGPLRFTRRLLGINLVRHAPVADGQIVDARDATLPRSLEGRRRAVLIRIHPSHTAPGTHLRQPLRHAPVEALEHRVNGPCTALVPAREFPAEPRRQHPPHLAPRVVMRQRAQRLRQRASPELLPQARRQEAVPARVRIPAHARPEFRKQPALRQRERGVAGVGIPGCVGEKDHRTALSNTARYAAATEGTVCRARCSAAPARYCA